jgi:mannose/fructose/N-acetylgalactosamine-specific phosphotransferase system component IIC
VFEEEKDNRAEELEVSAPAGEAAEPANGPSESAGTAMAHETEEGPPAVRAVAVALAGWLLPGLGHALLKMWGRALAIFLTVGFLVYLGAGMRGNVFAPGGDDAFTRLGYVADAGTGTFYFVARALESGGSDVSHADGDYGTRFLATAGVLNLLAALHAYEAARGRKA